MLGDLDAFSLFDDDKFSFHNDYWKQLFKVYPEDDRSYLGQENALFLILRIGLQILAQVRIMRT